MFDFWIPLALLFFVAIIAAITARRRRDRCLKLFDRKAVTILMDNKKVLWGKLVVFPKVLEIEFSDPVPDETGVTQASYVLYENEIGSIKKVLRPQPQEGSEAYEEWLREIQYVANPTPWQTFRRGGLNLFNMLRDAVARAIDMFFGSLKKKSSMSNVSDADKRAGEMGQTLLSTVANAYEPILEKYLNNSVVVEVLEDHMVYKLKGLLQEYSEEYLLLRNVDYKAEAIEGESVPTRFDMILPRSQALVRHRETKAIIS